MGILLVDNSNTRTKFSLSAEGEIGAWHRRILTKDLDENSISSLLEDCDFDGSVICSVVPEKQALLSSFLSAQGPTHIVSHQSKLGITVDYPKPEQIGADRLANAVAAHHRVGSPAIVVDFGTAVTFDIVGPNTAYLGGAIAPGLTSMTENLARRTALLPQIELSEPESPIGKSTEEAMLVGAVIGYRGLIRGIIEATKRELACNPTVIATGGDAPLIARGLPEISQVFPHLTLEGTLQIGILNL